MAFFPPPGWFRKARRGRGRCPFVFTANFAPSHDWSKFNGRRYRCQGTAACPGDMHQVVIDGQAVLVPGTER